MAPTDQWQVPDGYVALPITGNTVQGCLNICILFRREADPAQGHLVNLEPQIDARCLLGCLTDEQGCVHQWLEIVIQDVNRLALSIQAAHGVLNNLALDERWRKQARAENAPPFGPSVWSGWEIEHPPPLLIDPHAARIVHPVEGALNYILLDTVGHPDVAFSHWSEGAARRQRDVDRFQEGKSELTGIFMRDENAREDVIGPLRPYIAEDIGQPVEPCAD